MKKRILGKLALALTIAASMQTATVGVAAATTDHNHSYQAYSYETSYNYKDENSHICRRVYKERCSGCGEIRSATTEEPLSHNRKTERVWYYNEWCIREYCMDCGYQFHIGPENS